MPDALRLGTRQSALALAQARLVEGALRARHPGLAVEIVPMTTRGDVRRDVPLAAIGGTGVFTAEIEAALRAGEVDLAVHSAKDLPSALAPDMTLAALLPREDVRDVLVSRDGRALAELPAGARVGTSSPRRAFQLRAARPDLDVRDIRGNVDTRLRKLDAGEYDAIALAAAGLRRLGLEARVTEWLPVRDVLPAVGQGAIACEVRAADARAVALVGAVGDAATMTAVAAERAFLARLGAGCMAPTGAHAALRDGALVLEAFVGGADGTVVRDALAGDAHAPEALGRALADRLLAAGAAGLLGAAGTRPGLPTDEPR
jgi:hydroxymethylbilane synthase